MTESTKVFFIPMTSESAKSCPVCRDPYYRKYKYLNYMLYSHDNRKRKVCKDYPSE